ARSLIPQVRNDPSQLSVSAMSHIEANDYRSALGHARLRKQPRLGGAMAITVTSPSRLRVCRGAVAAFPLLLGVGTASAETMRAGKAFPTAFGFVPLDVGIREGIFKKHGIEIESTSFGGAPMLIQSLTAGAVDIGLDGGSDIAMIAKGMPGK